MKSKVMKNSAMYNENIGAEELELSIEDARDLGVIPEFDDYNKFEE